MGIKKYLKIFIGNTDINLAGVHMSSMEEDLLKTSNNREQYLSDVAKIFRDIGFPQIAEALDESVRNIRKDRQEVKSRLKNLMMHLLKYIYQEEKRSRSWALTIRDNAEDLKELIDSAKNTEIYAKEIFDDCFKKARIHASHETGIPLDKFPEENPFSLDELLSDKSDMLSQYLGKDI